MGLAVLVGVGVLAAVVVSVSGRLNGGLGGSGSMVTVTGVIGSEKQPFFDDPEVKAALRSHGYDVRVDTAGSRQIATTTDLSKYDFAFPAGVTAAEKIKRDRKVLGTYEPFYTPMVVASFKPLADLLAAQKPAVATAAGGYYTIDMKAYMDLVAQKKRWTDLAANTVYPASKVILVTSTDIRTSNSAATYLAIASYIANGNNIVQDQAQANRVLPVVEPLFLGQGFTETSSAGPFEDYLSIGIGKTPMVMIYESQFVARAAAKDGSISKDMVLMYPSPDLLSKHTLVALKPSGDAVGKLLQADATLQNLAIKYGFRTSNKAAFATYAKAHGVSVPDSLTNVVDPPTFEVQEFMISALEKKIGGQ